MEIIVLHDRYSSEPIIVRPDAINMIRKFKDEGEVYTNIVVEGFTLDVKEAIGDVMVKIKKVESEVHE